MAKQALVFKQFDGGLATDLKVGIKNSFAPSAGAGSLGSYAINFRPSPGQITVQPKPAREDAGTVIDLMQDGVMTRDGSTFWIGSGGNMYKRTTSGTWSRIGNIGTGTFGIDYRYDTDSIYIPSTTKVSQYKNPTGSPALNTDIYATSASTYNNSTTMGFNVAASQSGSTSSYTPPVSLTETSSNLRYFQSDIEPLTTIAVYIRSKGTGNWTLTLHDGDNNVLGTATVTNANLNNNAFNNFTFSSPIRIYVAANVGYGIYSGNARTYHFHLTSTVADGTISCSSSSDLSSADLAIYADRLISTQNGMHPMARFQQFECFGNGNYLSVWEPISVTPTNDEWLRHRLTFPSEYEVCGLAVFNEFLAIACEKTTSSSTDKPQEGIIFWWDGTSPNYNYFTKIPEGSPQAIHEHKNVIYFYSGTGWYAINSPAANPIKLRTMPGSELIFSGANAQLTVYPKAATVRRGIHLMAYPSFTTNTNINYGIYSWGHIDKNYPESFGYNYIISTGSYNYSASNNLTIGMVKNFNENLFISWRDSLNGGYGVDIVNNSSTPATSASWESIVFDNGIPFKEKTALYLMTTFLTLPSDASFRLKYKIDRGDWQYSDTITNSNLQYPKRAKLSITGQNRFLEIQIGIDITAGTTTPTFTSFTLVFDDNREEALS